MAEVSRAPQGPVATIDMGSNSFHLLIASWHEGQLATRFVAVERVQTALLMQGDRVTAEAERRILSCLGRFRASADEYGCQRIIAVGTSALRRARNASELLARAERILGWPVTVLSGADEARLIYSAVAFARGNPGGRMLVLDIGGGSTEIVSGNGHRIHDLDSLPLGCVSSLQRYFSDGQLTRDRVDACVRAARQRLAPVVPRFKASPGVAVVGCSGTALAIAGLLGLREVSRADLERLRDQLLDRFKRVDHIHLGGLDSNRSRLLVPGLCILQALVDAFAIERIVTVDVALREGVALAWYQGNEAVGSELSTGIAL